MTITTYNYKAPLQDEEGCTKY